VYDKMTSPLFQIRLNGSNSNRIIYNTSIDLFYSIRCTLEIWLKSHTVGKTHCVCWCTGCAWWIWCYRYLILIPICIRGQYIYIWRFISSVRLEMSSLIVYCTLVTHTSVVWWCILTDSVNGIWCNFWLDQSIEEVKYSISTCSLHFTLS
jgi:hypothetical protein